MLKYMLIDTVDREISTPQFFDSAEAAHAQMEKELLEQLDSYDYYKEGDDYQISELSAWANPHVDSDWLIFKVLIENGEITVIR